MYDYVETGKVWDFAVYFTVLGSELTVLGSAAAFLKGLELRFMALAGLFANSFDDGRNDCTIVSVSCEICFHFDSA